MDEAANLPIDLEQPPDCPALSVVLVCAGEYEVLHRTVEHLRRQSVATSLELLLMSPEPERVHVPDDVAADFHSVRVVPVSDERLLCAARAEGLRQARAPFVALAEDHCFPNRVWAEFLLAQHAEGADVVGPGMDNCNPGTATSWAAFLVAYGPWTGDGEARPMSFLPGHNSSYRQAVMLEFGKRLDTLMGTETVAHWTLHEHGHRVMWEPRARCRHVNLTRLGTLAVTIFHHSRVFGALRAQSTGMMKRLLYLATIPLVPPLRLYRSFRQIWREVPANISKLTVLGQVAVTLVASAAGEGLGLALGVGSSPRHDWKAELDRSGLVRREDQHLLEGHSAAGDTEPRRVPARSTAGPVGIGVIGCGDFAQSTILRVLGRLSDARIVALADPVAVARESAATLAPHASLYEHPAALLRDERVEGVVVAAPTGDHAELAIQVLEAGRHLYLEKPIATSLNDAQRIIESWRATGRIGMVGFNYRWHPGYLAIRRAIADGDIGKVVSIRTTFCTSPGQLVNWRKHPSTGGGVLLDLASHEVDLIRFVLGEPLTEVAARLSTRGSSDDTAHLYGRTASGVEVQGFYSFSAVEEAGMEVYGQAGKLTLDRYGGIQVVRRGASAPGPLRHTLQALGQWRGIRYLSRRARSPMREPSYAANLARFVLAIRSGTTASPSLLDGLHSLAVIAAAELASETGRVVPVSVPQASVAPLDTAQPAVANR